MFFLPDLYVFGMVRTRMFVKYNTVNLYESELNFSLYAKLVEIGQIER